MRKTTLLKSIICLVVFLTAAVTMAADAPEEVFMSFHKAMVAENLDEMLRFATAAQKKEMDALPADQKSASLGFLAKLAPKEISVLGHTPGGSADEMTLYAEGMGVSLLGGKPEKSYATAEMVREAGAWKVGKTEWNNERPAGLSKAVKLSKADANGSPAPEMHAEAAVPASTSSATPESVSAPGQEEKSSVAAESPRPAPAPVPKKPEKPKEQCEIKPVMTDAEIATCRRVATAAAAD